MIDGTTQCADCRHPLLPRVLQSAAGYYIGTMCHCGPYERLSGYYATEAEAHAALYESQRRIDG
jgi:hypothetical protein